MGGAKFLGRDVGVPISKESIAFECFLYWTMTGWLICFGLSMLFIFPPNFTIPFLVYIFGVIFFGNRYVKLEMKGGKK